jgi:hypothetical protein
MSTIVYAAKKEDSGMHTWIFDRPLRMRGSRSVIGISRIYPGDELKNDIIHMILKKTLKITDVE